MALMVCGECGNNVSDKATNCPSCGAPVVPAQKAKVQASKGCGCGCLSMILIVVAFFGMYASSSKPREAAEVKEPPAQPPAVKQDRKAGPPRQPVQPTTAEVVEQRRLRDAAAAAAEAAARNKADNDEAERILAAAREAERQDADARARVAEQRITKENLDKFVGALSTDEVAGALVSSASASKSGDIWQATVTVKSLWHRRDHQTRLQDAQTIQKVWAAVASPSDGDKARLKLVDANGNEVGGSRVWGGSLIWVKD